jgi:hypothetical protein
MTANGEQQPARSEFALQPIEVVSVLAAVGLAIVHLVRFARTPECWDWTSLVLVAAGLAAADFASGVVPGPAIPGAVSAPRGLGRGSSARSVFTMPIRWTC